VREGKAAKRMVWEADPVILNGVKDLASQATLIKLF